MSKTNITINLIAFRRSHFTSFNVPNPCTLHHFRTEYKKKAKSKKNEIIHDGCERSKVTTPSFRFIPNKDMSEKRDMRKIVDPQINSHPSREEQQTTIIA
jgi:hypothetical protein